MDIDVLVLKQEVCISITGSVYIKETSRDKIFSNTEFKDCTNLDIFEYCSEYF